jgi:hypothetical protein
MLLVAVVVASSPAAWAHGHEVPAVPVSDRAASDGAVAALQAAEDRAVASLVEARRRGDRDGAQCVEVRLGAIEALEVQAIAADAIIDTEPSPGRITSERRKQEVAEKRALSLDAEVQKCASTGCACGDSFVVVYGPPESADGFTLPAFEADELVAPERL